jgi:hypothetical protein
VSIPVVAGAYTRCIKRLMQRVEPSEYFVKLTEFIRGRLTALAGGIGVVVTGGAEDYHASEAIKPGKLA